MRMIPEHTLAIVVDCQEKLLPAMAGGEAVLESLITLVKGLALHNIPLVVAQQYTKGLGETVAPLKEAIGDFIPWEKTDFSVYSGERAEHIDQAGRKQVIICGIEAHVCVLQTVLDLREAGYEVFLVSDCIASRKESDKEAAILRAVSEGARITSYEAVLFELTRGKTHEQFKAISALVK